MKVSSVFSKFKIQDFIFFFQHYLSCAFSTRIANLIRQPNFGLTVSDDPIPEENFVDIGVDVEEEYELQKEQEKNPTDPKIQERKEVDSMEKNHLEKIKETEVMVLQIVQALRDSTTLNESTADFVNNVHRFASNCVVPQRDKLKKNTERTHVPVKLIMGNYKKKQKQLAEEKKRLKKEKQGGGDVQESIDQRYPLDLVWKNLIGIVPLDEENSQDWSSVLSLRFDKLKST